MAKRKQKRYNITTEKEKSLTFYQEHREELQKLIKTANRRWRDLEKRELPSRAIDEAMASRKRKYFRASDFQTRNGLRAMDRLRTFLADPTSKVRGAQYYKDTVTDVEEFRRQYGTSWQVDPETGLNVNNYNEYFTDKYGEDFTKRVYANYRRLEKDHTTLLNAGLLPATFDSDTLITLMFDRAIEDPSYYGDESESDYYSDQTNAPEFERAKRVLDYYDETQKEEKRRYLDIAGRANVLYDIRRGFFDIGAGGDYNGLAF